MCKQVFLMALPGVRVVLVSVIWKVGLWNSLRKRWRGATPFLASVVPPLLATTLFLPRSTRTHSISSGDVWATFCDCLHMRAVMSFLEKLCIHSAVFPLNAICLYYTSLWSHPTSSLVKREGRFPSSSLKCLIGYTFHFSFLLFSFLSCMTLICLTAGGNSSSRVQQGSAIKFSHRPVFFYSISLGEQCLRHRVSLHNDN